MLLVFRNATIYRKQKSRGAKLAQKIFFRDFCLIFVRGKQVLFFLGYLAVDTLLKRISPG
jgi:hypothetical protein